MKVSKKTATATSTLWHHTAQKGAELHVAINPAVVEELFSQQGVETKQKTKDEKKKSPSVVRLITCSVRGKHSQGVVNPGELSVGETF